MSQKKQLTEKEYRKKYPDLYKETKRILGENKSLLEYLRKQVRIVLEDAEPYMKLGNLQKRLYQTRRQYIRWGKQGLIPISRQGAVPVLDGVPLKKASIVQQKAYKMTLEMSSLIIPFSKETIRNIDENEKMMKRIEIWKKKEQDKMNKQYQKATKLKNPW